jgi:DNA replication protein DnaC
MSSQSTTHKQIMREYEMKRSIARRELEERKDLLFKNIPRLKEIDEEILLSGIRLTKLAFSSDINANARLEELKIKNDRLKAEREMILETNGYTKDFLKEAHHCSICGDTGYVNEQKCICYKQSLIDKHYEASGLKDTLKNENFDTFDFKFFSSKKDAKIGVSPQSNMQEIYTACSKFAKTFKQSGMSLMFSGDSGLGKTFMCNCIAKEVMDSGYPVLYVTAPAMFKTLELYRFSDDKTEEMTERINMLLDVDLLIIDDLGSEFYTVITGTELFNIINSRLLAKKSTVISTNLSEFDLQRTYSDRLASRFLGNYQVFYFFGDDIRIEKRLNY